MVGFPLYSRSLSGLSSDGKATADLKIWVSEELKEKLTGLAVLHDSSTSEYVRTVLQAHVYGHLHALRVRSISPAKEGTE